MHRNRTSPLFLSPTAARCPLAAARPLPPAACERLSPSSHERAAKLQISHPIRLGVLMFCFVSLPTTEPPLCLVQERLRQVLRAQGYELILQYWLVGRRD